MAYDRDRYEKTEYMGEENIKDDIWTSGRKGISRTRTSQELQELYNDLDIVAHIRKKRFEWIQHLVRRDHGKVVKKTFDSKPKGRRRMARSRLRRLEDVENGLWEIMVKRW
jgi:hypothetical protein